MTINDNDKLTEDNVIIDEGLSRLYQATKHDTPSKEADDAILAAARKATNSTSKATPHHGRKRQWAAPISIAAALVLSVGLARLVFQQDGDPLPVHMSDNIITNKSTKPTSTTSEYEESIKPSAPMILKKESADTALSIMAPAPLAEEPMSPGHSSELEQRIGRSKTSGTKEQGFTATEPMEKQAHQPIQSSTQQSLKSMDILQEELPISPEAWLQNIIELENLGKLAEALASLAEFKKQYPDYPTDALPDTLMNK